VFHRAHESDYRTLNLLDRLASDDTLNHVLLDGFFCGGLAGLLEGLMADSARVVGLMFNLIVTFWAVGNWHAIGDASRKL